MTPENEPEVGQPEGTAECCHGINMATLAAMGATVLTLLAMIVGGAVWAGAQTSDVRALNKETEAVHEEYREQSKELKSIKTQLDTLQARQEELHRMGH